LNKSVPALHRPTPLCPLLSLSIVATLLQAESGPSAWEAVVSGQLPSVLVIDDDDSVRTAIASVLRDAGWQAIEAADGEQGWAYLKGGLNPTVILLDVMMPKMNGAELM